MGIDVAWVNEKHEHKQDVFDPQQCLTKLATSAWPGSQTVCLRFIDAWGDTVFNQAQITVLLEELRLAERTQSESEIKAHLGKVVRLVERALDQTHTYIKFIGD
jgi:hypothetical protein